MRRSRPTRLEGTVLEGEGEEQQFRGDLGEAELKRLAAEARLHAIQPLPDRKGWDFEIELPSDDGSGSLDKRAPDLPCKIQVKSVSASAATVPIKLGNWERMAKQPFPWFVLVVVVDSDKVTGSYLVHIGKYWIGRTLETLRSQARKPGWQQRKMGLKWQPSDRLEPPDGALFRAALIRALGTRREPAEYAAAKKRVLDTVGYDGIRYSCAFSVKRDEGTSALAEMVVGLRDSVPVENLIMDELRFGVPVRAVDVRQALMKFEALPTRGPTRVTVTGSDGRRVTLEFETRRAGDIVETLPSEQDVLVLKGEYVQLVAKQNLLNLKFHATGLADPMPFDPLGRAAEFVRLFHDSRPVALQFEHDDQAPVTRTFRPEDAPTSTPPETDVIRALADAWAVCRRVGLDIDRLVPQELIRQWHMFVLVRAALECRRGLAGEFRPSGGGPLQPGTAAMVGHAAVVVGGTVCVIGLSARGTATEQTRTDGRCFLLEGVAMRAHSEELMAAEEFRAKELEVLARVRTQITADLEADGITILFAEPLVASRARSDRSGGA
jgi:Domain of unknown function (DUF4365)